MSVNNGVPVRKIRLVLIIREQASHLIVGAVIQVVQVILVVIRLRYRVVDHRIGKGKPPDDVRPAFPQRFKIHHRKNHGRG